MPKALVDNFMGTAAGWYKGTLLAFLIVNPLLLYMTGPFLTGWVIIMEFIFTLAMALKSYPLPAGGLIALQVVVLGLTNPKTVYHEVESNFPVLLLLMFMVAGIYFMRELLLLIFSNMLIRIRSKIWLSFVFAVNGAVLSAFLDALTVVAMILAVGMGFYAVYHRYASMRGEDEDHDHHNDQFVHHQHHEELEQFRSFLRSLLMHSAVGTALGGVCTLVGEPQNLIIGHVMGWDFSTFFLKMAPVSLPVLFIGLLTTVSLEKLRWFGYGTLLPESVREVMSGYVRGENERRTERDKARLAIQALAAIVLVVSLATHIAEVGLIGLTIIILLTAFTGVTEEHRIGHAFTESLPFAGLLVVFFAIVAMIHDQNLFKPIIDWTLSFEGKNQILAFFGASGALSSGSDNVFVATVYITEAKEAYDAGLLTLTQFEKIAVGINAGTNIISVATPNGQAAFLFLLTSPIAGLIRLSYVQMLWMAVPFTLTMSVTAFVAIHFFL